MKKKVENKKTQHYKSFLNKTFTGKQKVVVMVKDRALSRVQMGGTSMSHISLG